MYRLFIWCAVILASCTMRPDQEATEHPDILVIGYYAGNAENIVRYSTEQLTHLIYSFLHLEGNRLAVDDSRDSATIQTMINLKEQHPELKILLALGGWGGCKTCSGVFSSDTARREFASSAREVLEGLGADGLDLDWEYPAIQGPPGHPFAPEDKQNFTALIRTLRDTLGPDYEITFAAGGFRTFFDESVEWDKVMPLLDRVHIMSYDLFHGYSTSTGHHTPLYSTNGQAESVDFAVRYLDSLGVPREKMVIGAAFYARIWEHVAPANNGLYNPGRFKRGVPYKRQDSLIGESAGFESYWDSVAMAPYRFNASDSLFTTFDDTASLRLKTEYAFEQGLGGIMFWQLGEDVYTNGLLQSIHDARTRLRVR